MTWMTRWIMERTARRMRSQQAVAARAAEVIDQVIFDLGVPRLMQGTLRLDPGFRPRFHSSTHALDLAPQALAWVPLARLADTVPREFGDDDPAVLAPHTAALVDALLQEFRAQSPRFRALREHA